MVPPVLFQRIIFSTYLHADTSDQKVLEEGLLGLGEDHPLLKAVDPSETYCFDRSAPLDMIVEARGKFSGR